MAKKPRKNRALKQAGVTSDKGETPMSQYLERVGSTYYFRRVVPQDLQQFFRTKTGRSRIEFKVSLGTKDRREGERRSRLKALETDRLFDAAREALAQQAQTARPSGLRSMSEGELEQMEAESEANFVTHEQWVEREPSRDAILSAVSSPGLSEAIAAMRDLIDDRLLASDLEQARQADGIAVEWEQGALEVAKSNGALNPSAANGNAYPRLMDLFNGYVAEAKPQPATVKRWKPVIEHLIVFLKHDDASLVSRVDVVRWKNFLLSESMGGKPLRGPKTVRETYLAALKVVLAWGTENARLTGNAANGVTVRAQKTQRLREQEFTKGEVSTILKATSGPWSDGLTPEHRLARWWVPWLCAYSGARVNEITQLRAEDVQVVDRIWCMRITPEAGGQKSQTARLVPLHEHLIDQGFVAFAHAKGKGPLFYDPRRYRQGAEGNPHFKKVGERLAKWVRSLGVNDPDVQPNHAWRHLFKTIARDSGMDPEAREAIPGHAASTEGRKYGSRSLEFLARELGKFPRFEVEP
jgi:integrase